jgi:hypothetical protein
MNLANRSRSIDLDGLHYWYQEDGSKFESGLQLKLPDSCPGTVAGFESVHRPS